MPSSIVLTLRSCGAFAPEVPDRPGAGGRPACRTRSRPPIWRWARGDWDDEPAALETGHEFAASRIPTLLAGADAAEGISTVRSSYSRAEFRTFVEGVR
jgi:hypothetical protein